MTSNQYKDKNQGRNEKQNPGQNRQAPSDRSNQNTRDRDVAKERSERAPTNKQR